VLAVGAQARDVQFPEAVRAHRARCGLSQGQLARRLGVRQQSVSRWEAGVALPTPQRVVQLEDALGLERGTLWRAIGYPDGTGSTASDPLGEVLTRLPSLTGAELDRVRDAIDELRRTTQTRGDGRSRSSPT
jgi:transcriptional regulator with XRE-family HTH domain